MKIFFKHIIIEPAEYNNKWKVSDKRRKIFYVEFNNGNRWYPRDAEIKAIVMGRKSCFEHNIQFPNIDPQESVCLKNTSISDGTKFGGNTTTTNTNI